MLSISLAILYFLPPIDPKDCDALGFIRACSRFKNASFIIMPKPNRRRGVCERKRKS
jgi:hypothetical protein